MSTDQRSRVVTLVLLTVALAGVLAWQFWPAAAVPPSQPGSASRPGSAAGPAALNPRDLDVRLDALQVQVAEPDASSRDPFAFRAAAPPPAPPPPVAVPRPGGPGGGASGETANPGPPPLPPPPPITLKFIGLIVEGAAAGAGKIAVLSDGRFVFHGREGDIIEGRYRVVRIGDESLQMEHVDGRGRQTIRLSGS